MDYRQFYGEVVEWIGQANQMAVRYGIGSEMFWDWVMKSAAEVCNRYGNHPLVIKQMIMFTDWLDEVLERSKVS